MEWIIGENMVVAPGILSRLFEIYVWGRSFIDFVFAMTEGTVRLCIRSEGNNTYCEGKPRSGQC